ncbi:MAG: hypothetical protein E7533_00635 [Ruminococcaceae bacterium]|nr:hypothetical protein [Oscillospiraceae bacterium]
MKRLISIILAVLILVPSFVFYTFASDEGYVKLDTTISGRIDYNQKPYDFSSTVTKSYYKKSVGSADYRCYSLLNDMQRMIYDTVVDSDVGVLTFHFSFEYGEFPISYFSGDFFNELMNAISLDNPQIFYYGGYALNQAYVYSDQQYVAMFDYVVDIFNGATYVESELSANYNAMMNVVKTADVDLSNRFNFVKSVHDFLCEIGTYPDLNSADYTGNCHDAYGCLVEKKPVCQGYADAFKLFCDYYNIPCVCIGGKANGGNHMWNAVQMDDGYWYLIDATWDDQESYGIFYDFFLSGTDTVSSYAFGSEPFKESHVNDANIYLPSLNYATNEYSQSDHYTGFEATYNCATIDDEKYLILSFFDAFANNIYYDGMYVDVDKDELATGTNLSLKNSEDWNVVLVGDCNADGVTDSTDYSVLVNNALLGVAPSDACEYACDANVDNVIDAIDVAILERAYTGNNTNIVIE